MSTLPELTCRGVFMVVCPEGDGLKNGGRPFQGPIQADYMLNRQTG
jgi:hypothetical protein